MNRPPLLHEKLAAEAKRVLDDALHADLTERKRSDLTLLRLELDSSKRMQSLTVFPMVAPWEDWRAAFSRVEAEIARRPAPARKRRWEK